MNSSCRARSLKEFLDTIFVAVSIAVTIAVSPPALFAEAAPPLLLRSPSLSQSTIAFRYADDIWTVARTGGEAQRLTSEGGVSDGPFYSPDGSQIAYAVRLHGSKGVAYIIPSGGGIPRRITWHPEGSSVVGWTPDGKDVVVQSPMASHRHYLRLYKVHSDGSGLPEALPLPSAFRGSYSSDGQSFAYEPISRWEPEWKRYHGGQNIPLWVVNLKTLDLTKIPSGNTMDSDPVWIGDSIYFLSDRATALRPRWSSAKSKPVRSLFIAMTPNLKTSPQCCRAKDSI